MLYTSYFARLKDLPDNVIPVSICGRPPDWYKGLQYKKLAPHYDFFIRWKCNRDDEMFIKCYNECVLGRLDPLRVIMELHMLLPELIKLDMQSPVYTNPYYHIALICFEKPTDFCHRHLVADWLNEHGIKCEEWRKWGNENQEV